MTPVQVTRGRGPIVLGLPHAGTYVPENIRARLNDNGRKLTDTDWHIDRLYDGLLDDVTAVKANFHRYVIDANRDPDGNSLYPGQNTTTLVPLSDFDGNEIWERPPSSADIADRRDTFHRAYHDALTTELERVRSLHGIAILYDCHSIRSRIPYLFDGVLPDFNIGTNMGTTCAATMQSAVEQVCASATAFSTITNGRFRGGWTTRHYGRPETGIHAIQMELAQATYLSSEAAPWTYDPTKADRLRPHLHAVLTALADLARNQEPQND